MTDIGRVCIKIAGRDAGKFCVVTEKIDDNFVMIDGETRRRKCNVRHLEPTEKTLDIKKGDHEEVKGLFESVLSIKIADSKPKESKEKPKRQRKSAAKEAPAEKKASMKKSQK